MNKKVQKLVEPSMKMYLIVMAAFSVITFFFQPIWAAAEGLTVILLAAYSKVSATRNQKRVIDYIESITYDMENAKNNSLLHFPLPLVVYRLEDNQVIWGNSYFFDMCGIRNQSFDVYVGDLITGFQSKWLLEGKTVAPDFLDVRGRKYQVHGNIVSGEEISDHNFMGLTYFLDVTELVDYKLRYEASKPVVAVIVIDNYDELLKNLPDRERNELRSEIEDTVTSWCDGKNGILRRYDRDRFLFIFEEQYLNKYIEEKFSLLELVRHVINPSGIHATVSLGIGKDGASFEENQSFAMLSIEMALSRGGDQAVIKNRFTFEFFGGRGSEVETRTKVKSRVMANALSQLISDASKTYVMGHKFSDLDALGAAVGVCCIARAQGADARIVINLEKNLCGQLLDKLRKNEAYADTFISPEDAVLSVDNKSLLVIVDTNRPEQVEDETLLNSCNKVVVIDHHRRAATYIKNAALTLYEPFASSVCELMAELLQELVGQSDILKIEAEAMMSGIVMDTKSFTLRTGERTFDAAAFLRRAGADTTVVKRYLQNDLEHTVSRYKLLQGAKIYKGSIAIAAPDTPQDRVVAAQAADELLNVSGITASIVTYPTAEHGAIISARSIGDINVQVLLEGLGGGGNKSAAGAQVKDMDFKDVVDNIFKAIDDYFAS